jgi:hypothetical protein
MAGAPRSPAIFSNHQTAQGHLHLRGETPINPQNAPEDVQRSPLVVGVDSSDFARHACEWAADLGSMWRDRSW